MKKKHRGSCLCGAVRFSFETPLDDIWFCHCGDCRKNYGMYGAFAGVPREAFHITGGKKLARYASSTGAVRSFCKKCGSPITWDLKKLPVVYILLGLLDGKAKIKGGKHIWVSDKGSYYQILDGRPQYRIYPK